MEIKRQELVESFEEWFAMILRILAAPKPKQPVTNDTGLVGGYDLLGLDALIKESLIEHMEASNEHQLTVDQLGSLTTEEIYNLFANYQNGHSVPLSKIPNLASKTSVDWTGRKLTVTGPNKVTYLGKEVTLPTMTVNLPTTNVHQVSLVVTGPYTNRTYSLEALETPTVAMSRIPILKINLSAKTVSGRVINRIGMHELSTTSMGTGIPVSTGNQSRSGAIAGPWWS